jgi:FAD/FMN-containing dehydrogenase/Fe-S oxidoreductase
MLPSGGGIFDSAGYNHRVDTSAEYSQDLLHDLQRTVRGEMRFDTLSRQIYSTDASNYRILPLGVVIPRDEEDVLAAVEIANRHGVSLVPRGSGTSLSGQAIGPGLVLDFSRHLNHILEINPAGQWVRVEAGVVLDQLNAALQPYGFMVGPNPASSPVATLGGMAGNNSTGSRSILYGLMVDHVHQVDVVLSDGSRVRLRPKTLAEAEAIAKRTDLEGSLYRGIPLLLDRYREDILTGYPRTWRNVAGYNLNRLRADLENRQPLNLASLVVGSEGTLATILNLRLNIVPRPRYTHLSVLHYTELRGALDVVPLILKYNPSAVELLDRMLIDMARAHPGFAQRLSQFVVGFPEAILIVEFSGDEPEALASQASTLVAKLTSQGYKGTIVYRTKSDEIENVWSVRREVNGLIMSRPGDTKPLTIVDDAAVPPDELAAYVDEVDRACREEGIEVNFDSHASAGCLHINPGINLKTEDGLRRMQAISQAIMQISIRHQGTTTGEHGEGLARSYYNEQLYGPRLHQAFREVKHLFDPQNRMNPGKIVDSPAPWDPAVLRIHPGYYTPLAPAKTYLDFSPHAGFAGQVEMCNGQGVCRSLGSGVMCPSFRVTQDETHSTRGRANALRAAMSGQLGENGMTSQELFDALDLCLECKACKRECSTLVDMAKLKYEFLAQYQAKHGVPLRSRLFGHINQVNRMASISPGLANWAFRNSVIRELLDQTLGIDKRRGLPPVVRPNFRSWFKTRQASRSAPRGPIILWDDTYITYNEPEIGKAAVRILEAAGFEVRLIKDRMCCGRPLISKGFLDEARQNADHNVVRLSPFAADGVPIIGLEPSCIATFRDEYPAILRSEAARQVANASFFIEEFLARLAQRGDLNLPLASLEMQQQILLHGHCYQKSYDTSSALVEMVKLLPDTEVEEIPSGCCGMAGSFGYEKEHYEVSMACGEERLFPAVRAASQATIIAAAGTSCRAQILEGTGRQAVHPILLLAGRLVPENRSRFRNRI